MDAFKLLTKSTNLSNQRCSKAPITPPSAARNDENPQLFGQAEEKLIAEETHQPKRRKTRHGAPSDLSDLPEELNFFSEAQPSRKLAKQATTAAHHEAPRSQSDLGAEQWTPLTDEDCRRIMKAHKLKVTRWDASPLSPLKVKRDKTKKKEEKLTKGVNRKREASAKQLHSEPEDITPQPITSFGYLEAQCGLTRRLARNVSAQDYKTPTEIQMVALPLLLSNKPAGPETPNLMSVAPTGSGKTLAFLIPLIQHIQDFRHSTVDDATASEGPMGIVLAPTKELASQIANEARKLTDNTGVKVSLVRKGMRIAGTTQDSNGSDRDNEGDTPHEDATSISHISTVKAHILVSTPGVLTSALSSKAGELASLPSVRRLVFDEADVLLDPLFKDQTFSIWKACINQDLRVSLWSATMGASVEDLARHTLERREQAESNPISAAPLLRIVVGLKDSAIPNVQHKLIYCATEPGKLMAMREILHPATSQSGTQVRPPFLVFTQTIARAVALHAELAYDIPASAGGSTRIATLHADLSDVARDDVMARFRRGEIWVLITTDLLSRGVDFRGVNGVVNYDFPGSSAAYVHRVGRTGRAGRSGGVAVTLYAKEDLPVLGVVANVVAASEKQRDAASAKSGVAAGEGMEKWLLELLPKVSKKQKRELKRGGIESRRTGGKGGRISTKVYKEYRMPKTRDT